MLYTDPISKREGPNYKECLAVCGYVNHSLSIGCFSQAPGFSVFSALQESQSLSLAHPSELVISSAEIRAAFPDARLLQGRLCGLVAGLETRGRWTILGNDFCFDFFWFVPFGAMYILDLLHCLAFPWSTSLAWFYR